MFDFSLFFEMYSKSYPNKIIPTKSFLEWLIGFTEGDGSFIVTKRGHLQFVITQSSIDVQVLYFIMKSLGFGKVLKQSSNTHRFIVQDMANIFLLCLIFNGNMVFLTRNSKFITFLSVYNDLALKMKLNMINPILYTLLPTLQDNWLAGFTDAEGCFSLSLLSNSIGYRLRFLLCHKWEINKSVLQHISSLFNVGTVSSHSVKNNWEFIVNGVKNTSNILSYFDTHKLYSKKNESYKLWKQLRNQLINKDHLNKDSRLNMIKLAKSINKS